MKQQLQENFWGTLFSLCCGQWVDLGGILFKDWGYSDVSWSSNRCYYYRKREHKAHHSCKPCHEDDPVRCYIWYGIHIYRFRAGSRILYKIDNLEKMVFFPACIKPQWYEENGEEDNAAKQFYSRSRYELLFQYSIGKSYSVISILSL